MLGSTIIYETEPANNSLQVLGNVGSQGSLTNLPGVEVRGTTSIDINSGSIDFDYYQATADWFRNPFDYSDVEASVSLSVSSAADAIAGLSLTVFDAFGNIVISGVDFIVGSEVKNQFGNEFYDILENSDQDFISDVDNEFVNRSASSWSYDQVAGFYGNTFVVAIAGFEMDMNGNLSSLAYNFDWDFA